MSVDSVLSTVSKKITPTQKEQKETKAVVDNVLNTLNKILKPKKLSFTIAGSFTRDTWMKDKKEFDVFVMFPEGTLRDDLQKQGLAIGKKLATNLKGKYKIAYAEHPYVRATVGKYDVDIVPCYKLKDATKIKSAVDRTPFHNEWMSKHLPKKLSSEVRLLKQFTKGIGVYGSDTKTEGFSGYLCELLTVEYGSFKNLIRAAAKWEPGKVLIDIANHHKDRHEEIKKHFSKSPMIMIDPVDPNRNVSAVVSPANFVRFSLACKDFMKKPTTRPFMNWMKTPKSSSQRAKKIATEIKKRETVLLGIEFKQPDIIDDVLWPQLRRTGNRLKGILEDHEFEVMNWDVYADGNRCIIFLELNVWRLPKVRKIYGPDIFAEDRVKEFTNKYKPGRVWVEGDRWVAEIERKFDSAEPKLKETLSDPLKDLREKGIASYVAKAVQNKNFSILNQAQIASRAKKNARLLAFLENFFRRDFV
ncbi:MAG: CCA tRNA nucleotidyltransferase [Nanoarchaeota archaeon]|nr:CCA tRNA nucleotidyltransferase [Nanoarchaeota archaeon]